MSKSATKRYYDGRKGVIKCSECLNEKTKDEVEQVKSGRTYKYVCSGCQ